MGLVSLAPPRPAWHESRHGAAVEPVLVAEPLLELELLDHGNQIEHRNRHDGQHIGAGESVQRWPRCYTDLRYTLDRYTAPDENVVLVVSSCAPYSGAGARSAPKESGNRPRALPEYQGRARGCWWNRAQPGQSRLQEDPHERRGTT